MDKQTINFYLALSAFAFGCFAVAYFLVTYCVTAPQYLKGLLFAVPGVVLLLITYGVSRQKLSDGIAFFLTLLLILLSLLAVPVLFFYLSLEIAITEVEDVASYERILRLTSVDEKCEGLLPKHIPENAENVYFHYRPQVLQGGSSFILAFQTDAASLASYETILEENALWTGTYAQAMEENRNVRYPFDLTEKLQDNYVLYVLEARPEIGRGLNHGAAYTVTLNYESGAIVFDHGQW